MGARATQRYRRWAGRVRGWPVWELPRWLTVFVAVTTAAYVAVIAIAGSQTDFRLHDIALFALLLAFGAASIELTRRSGESAGLSMDVNMNNLDVRVPGLPLYGQVHVGNTSVSVTVNPFIFQAGAGWNF